MMHVLHAATECAPFAKAGGLGDVVGALPLWTPRAAPDISVSVLIPGYGFLGASRDGATIFEGSARFGSGAIPYRITTAAGNAARFPLFFVRSEHFEHGGIYPHEGALERQAVLSHAAASLSLASQGAPIPRLARVDLLHAHDHHAALACALLEHWPAPVHCPSVLTVHNARYPGDHDWHAASALELPASLRHGDCDHDGRFNSLKCGLLSADAVTTVSPTHAFELSAQPHASHGLDYVFRQLGTRFRGILNGIDTDAWNPATDPHLEAHYDASDLSGKRVIKDAVCREHRLDSSRPLVAYIGRLVPEKGIEQLLEALPLLVPGERDIQVLVLGTGESRFHDALGRFEHEQLPAHVRTALRHDETLAHRLYAAADILVMPSWYEPCGLSQMYALRYGTIPVVFPTGGLADSILPFKASKGRGNGVHMRAHDAAAVAEAVRSALRIWREPGKRARIIANAMATDLSWTRSARSYAEVYRSLSPGARLT